MFHVSTFSLHNQKAGVTDLIRGLTMLCVTYNMTVEYAASVRVMQVAGLTQHFLPQKTVVKEQLFNKHMCGEVEPGEFACERSWVIFQ